MPNCTPCAATRRSQASANSRPPPIAGPLIAATVGRSVASSACSASVKGWATIRSASTAKTSAGMSPMSYPDENQRPSPVEHDAAGARVRGARDLLADGVEDRVIERPALVGVRDRQAKNALRRLVAQQLPGHEAAPYDLRVSTVLPSARRSSSARSACGPSSNGSVARRRADRPGATISAGRAAAAGSPPGAQTRTLQVHPQTSAFFSSRRLAGTCGIVPPANPTTTRRPPRTPGSAGCRA